MKNSSKRILTLVILFISVAMFSIVAVSAATASTPQIHTTLDDSVEIDAKYKKASSNKVTFNANGGKIGSKKTIAINIKKGAKINKFPSTPKMTGYKFMGWYNKKSGGKKVTVSTKPTKNIVLYAQWTKKPSSRVLNAEEKRLVGQWDLNWDGSASYKFNADGTYFKVNILRGYDAGFKGYYSVKNGKLTLRYQHAKDYTGVGFHSKSLIWGDWESSGPDTLEIYTKDGKQYMIIDDGLPYRKVS